MIYAFAYEYEGLSKKLMTDVFIKSNERKASMSALWDTGATKTCISKEIATKLGLIPLGKQRILTPSGAGYGACYFYKNLLEVWIDICYIVVTNLGLGAMKMTYTRDQVLEFIKTVPDNRLAYVMALLKNVNSEDMSAELLEKTKKRKKLGGMEGKIWMADDFNEPLECFEEYMP